jgi:hypothetical protein
MVKVWDTDICAELKSFGGHTGSVTAVMLLSEEETKKYGTLKESANLFLCIYNSSSNSPVEIAMKSSIAKSCTCQAFQLHGNLHPVFFY